jgi:hypothetical protein
VKILSRSLFGHSSLVLCSHILLEEAVNNHRILLKTNPLYRGGDNYVEKKDGGMKQEKDESIGAWGIAGTIVIYMLVSHIMLIVFTW